VRILVYFAADDDPQTDIWHHLVLSGAPGCSWLLLAAPGSSSLLLAASGCSWLLAAPASGCSWLLLAASKSLQEQLAGELQAYETGPTKLADPIYTPSPPTKQSNHPM